MSNSKIYSDISLLCYLCADNLVLVADTLGFISPNGYAGCIEQLPSQQDLVVVSNRQSEKGRRWFNNIKKWSDDMRNESQAEKIRKLQS